MPNRVYALLVGINDYGPDVEALDGCLNDVDLFHDYLRRQVDPAALAVDVLENGDATRANVIAHFRSHLGQAGPGDIAVFQFCGHGARWASSAAFREAFPEGRDEGLVCFDSRRGADGYDLADKELAVLIADVAANEAQMVVVLDCCHSGSATRGVDGRQRLKPRLTQEITTERPLETYLDGHYARLREAGASLFVPAGRHILLAACERGQLAQEASGHGVFTSTLVDVLDKSGGALSYADLFVRCRAAVRSRAFDQDPQFEAYDRFDAGAGFLGRPLARGSRARYLASCDQGVWIVECGAIAGVPSDLGVDVAFALYADTDPTTPAGTARAVQVGPRTCEIALDFESAESARYMAEMTSLPAAPLAIAWAGDDEQRAAIQGALTKRGVAASLVGAGGSAAYALTMADARLTLRSVAGDVEIGFAELAGTTLAGAASSLAPAVHHVRQWERALALQNARTAIDRSQVDVVYLERLADGGERTHDGAQAHLTYARLGGQWRAIPGRLRVRNRTGQALFVLLVYFSDAFGIHVLGNAAIAPGEAWLTVWGDDPRDTFNLPEGVDQSLERFKLIVSSEKIDDFLLAQPELTLGDEYGATRAAIEGGQASRPVYTNEWFAKDFHARVVRETAGSSAAGKASA